MVNEEKILEQMIEKLGVNDHLCLIYENREEQFAAVIPFMRIGLERGEKCVYIADDNTASVVMDAMIAGGIDVDSAVNKGTLAVITKREAYLREGYFDPDLMIGFLKEATDKAKVEGYAALRVTGEMTWMLGGEPGTGKLIEYEAKLNYFFPNNDALAICQYNKKRFKPEIIIDVIKTHPLVVYGDLVCKNFYYVPPDEFLKIEPFSEVERLLENIIEREKTEKALLRGEEQLRKLNEELEQRVKERTAELEAFSYSVSHDLRAPLRAIDGFSNILLYDYRDRLDDEGRRLLNVVRENTKKMGQLIEDMLQFSRMGRKEMSMAEIDIEKLVNDVYAEIKPSIPERKIQFTVKPLAPAYGDPSMLRQVVSNLLSNAVKFTRQKDAVIEVGMQQPGTGQEAIGDKENIYYVKDNGVGFDMKYADKLFGVFQRLHSMEEFEGTGIGLAIVKRIITRHGGRVWADGKVGEGTVFYFTLPKRQM